LKQLVISSVSKSVRKEQLRKAMVR